MSLGIIEGIGAMVGAEALAILSPKNIPPHIKLCKRLGAGFVAMSTTEVVNQVLAETNSPALQTGGGEGVAFRDALYVNIDNEQLFLDPRCPLKPQGSALYTNAEKQIPGLNTITALPIGKQITSKAISSIPIVGSDLNFALTTSPRGLVNPKTGAFVSQVGGQIGSIGISGVGEAAIPALGAASIVMGFTQDGVLGGIANTLTTVAYFDPEPISRVILTIVGSIFGAIFGRHAARVRLERAVECASGMSANEALRSIDAAVMAGNILPEHGCQLLDHLFTSYKASLDKYGLVGRGSSSWGCNAGCELLWYFTGIIIRKKDRFLHLVDAPCPPAPKVKLQAQPQVYVNSNLIAQQNAALEGRASYERFV